MSRSEYNDSMMDKLHNNMNDDSENPPFKDYDTLTDENKLSMLDDFTESLFFKTMIFDQEEDEEQEDSSKMSIYNKYLSIIDRLDKNPSLNPKARTPSGKTPKTRSKTITKFKKTFRLLFLMEFVFNDYSEGDRFKGPT